MKLNESINKENLSITENLSLKAAADQYMLIKSRNQYL